ncbi:DUF2250 domain-containing protein [Halorubrum sp. DTA98]|uniref:DUF2250 domain-containing protein n=1 Tax=Halorubrum sp. DTA98 TaxID=3402163 RepID=UPI003AAF6BC3
MSSSDEVERPPPESEEVGPSPEIDLTRSDRRVLSYLVESSADYPALIAGNTGLHVAYVERRIESMVEAGLIEDVSGEVVYRITAAGRDVLDATS